MEKIVRPMHHTTPHESPVHSHCVIFTRNLVPYVHIMTYCMSSIRVLEFHHCQLPSCAVGTTIHKSSQSFSQHACQTAQKQTTRLHFRLTASVMGACVLTVSAHRSEPTHVQTQHKTNIRAPAMSLCDCTRALIVRLFDQTTVLCSEGNSNKRKRETK